MIKLNILDYLLLITVRIKDFQNYSNVFPLYTLIKIGGPQFRTSAKTPWVYITSKDDLLASIN